MDNLSGGEKTVAALALISVGLSPVAGDEVVVKVKNTDLVKKHLDFTLLGKPQE